MARRMRRRPRVVWLPVHGRDFAEAAEGENFGNGIGGILTVPQTGEITADVQDVTFDYSDSASGEEGTESRSLQDLTSGNAYRLRRIVGKFHAAAVVAGGNETEIPTVDIAAGFMVNRTDDNGNILAGQQTITGDVTRGPLAQDGAEDPWIWRRRWLLTAIPPVVTFASGSGLLADIRSISATMSDQGQWPQTTAGYGSVADGPHIDQKTARVISRDERLFFWVQARLTNPSPETEAATVPWQLDLRLLASLRQNIGNRRNASR